MQLASVWSDLYGSTLALYAGRAGGHRWLVASPPEQAARTAEELGALSGKGETVLLVYAGLTPLLAALREQSDPVLGRGLSGVLVVDRALSGGPALTVPSREVQTGDGLTYLDGGSFPAWTDALGRGGPQGDCAAASLSSGLGLPVRVCAPGQVAPWLQEWWTTTPHAREAVG